MKIVILGGIAALLGGLFQFQQHSVPPTIAPPPHEPGEASDKRSPNALLQQMVAIVGSARFEGVVTSLGRGDALSGLPLTAAHGDMLLTVHSGDLVARRSGSEAEVWRFRAQNGTAARILASDLSSLYIACFPLKDTKTQTDPVVSRVELSSGKALGEFGLEPLKPPWLTRSITAVCPGPTGVAVLTRSRQSKDPYEWETPEQASVHVFSTDTRKLLWRREWQQKPFIEGRGFLLASAYPNFSDSSVVPLVWVEGLLLVTSNPAEPIRVLGASDGKELSKLERLWEFRRGFIGPSVWAHFLSRGAKDDFFERERTAEPDKTVEGKILAGPVVVEPFPARFGRNTHLAYVVVHRSVPGGYSEYTGDCFVYELSIGRGGLRPISLAALPRNVLPQSGWIDGQAVVWPCQDGALVRISPSDSATGAGFMGMGPGGPDCLSRVEWYREFLPVQPGAWLLCDKTPSQVVRVGNQCIRAAGPPSVMKKGDSIMHFPMAVVDLRSGASRALELQAVLKNPIPTPVTNYSSTDLGVRTSGPYYFGLSALNVAGGKLETIAGSEDAVYRVSFELSPILSALTAIPAN